MSFFPQLVKYEEELKAKVESDHKAATDAEESPASVRLAHLSFLNSFIRSEYAETFDELSSLLVHDEISFELLWALYIPRSILYTPCPVTGSPRAVRVRSVEIRQKAVPGAPPGTADGPRFWAVDAEYVEYNASHASGDGQPMFGHALLMNMEVPFFAGTEKITSLPFYPMKYYHDAEDLKARLIERGKRWVGLQGLHHLFYDGIAFQWNDQERRYKKQTVSMRGLKELNG